MATLPTAKELALEMLRKFVVEDQHRTGETIAASWLLNQLPIQKDRSAALDYALQNGWITEGMKITEAGFAAAPEE